MQVQNIECQIAQAQIGRFLGGGGLSDEAVSQLEGHIAACTDCKAFLEAKRSALQSMLGSHAAVSAPADRAPQARSEMNPGLLGRLREQLLSAAAAPNGREPAQTRRAMLKPLFLSVSLAVVLVAMTLLSKNPTALFGERALPMTPAASTDTPATVEKAPAAKPTPPAAADSTTEPASKGPSTAGTTPPAAAVTAPSERVSQSAPSQARPQASKPEGRPSKPAPAQAMRPLDPKPRAAQPDRAIPKPNPHGSIRVYDADGNPISPGSGR